MIIDITKLYNTIAIKIKRFSNIILSINIHLFVNDYETHRIFKNKSDKIIFNLRKVLTIYNCKNTGYQMYEKINK